MSELPARRRLREKEHGGVGETADLSADSADLSHAWETFGAGSKAGQLLRQLYGSRDRVKVDYPRVSVRRESESCTRRPFIPGGGKLDVDPREHKLSDASVPVPKFYPKSRFEFHPIDFVDRKKSEQQIRDEMSHLQEYLDHYRPHPGKSVSTLLEKERLQMNFQFRGGKALPDSVAYPTLSGDLPSSEKAQEYLDRHNEQRSHRKQPDRLTEEEYNEMLEKILTEIDERQRYLADLDRLGELSKHAFRVQREIEDRLKDLEDLEKLRTVQLGLGCGGPWE